MHILTNKAVLMNAAILIASILTAAGVSVGIDAATIQTVLTVIATVVNALLHHKASS